MSGKHNGVQKRITDVDKKSNSCPCSKHCLNLAAVHPTVVTTNSVTFLSRRTIIYILLLFHSSMG